MAATVKWSDKQALMPRPDPAPAASPGAAAAHFPHRILVCVTGLTPQVVTETVYALVTRQPAWLPTQVHVLTTVTGARHARSLLLPDGQGHFSRLCDDYGLSGIGFGFDESCIHVLADAAGQPLDDIRSPEDNMAMADAIVASIARFAADDQCQIHVSLAGGRKSMGFFAGYALSLYGRPQDRLSHVLVSSGFETNPDFFYPPPVPRVLTGRNGEPLSTADARVDLAEIPFVRLRDRLPSELLSGGRFADAVAAAQRLESPRLVISLGERRVICGEEKIPLSPVNFAIYAWHVQRTLGMDAPAVALADFNAIDAPLRRDLAAFGARLYPRAMSAEAQSWEECRLDDNRIDFSQWLAEKRSRINSAIRRSLGKTGEKVYGIVSEQTGGRRSRHRLGLAADCIEILP